MVELIGHTRTASGAARESAVGQATVSDRAQGHDRRDPTGRHLSRGVRLEDRNEDAHPHGGVDRGRDRRCHRSGSPGRQRGAVGSGAGRRHRCASPRRWPRRRRQRQVAIRRHGTDLRRRQRTPRGGEAARRARRKRQRAGHASIERAPRRWPSPTATWTWRSICCRTAPMPTALLAMGVQTNQEALVKAAVAGKVTRQGLQAALTHGRHA